MNKILMSVLFFITTCHISYAETLNVVTENWRPYNYFENGEVKGLATDVVKKVLDNTDIDYKIEVLPWARAYQNAQTNPNTLIYTIIRIPSREKLFKWVRPLGKGGTTSLYRLKSRPEIYVNNIDEARNLTVSTNQDSMDHLWLMDNGFKKLEATGRVKSAIHMFFLKRVDAIAFDDSVMKSGFEKNGYSMDDVEPMLELFTTPPYMAVSPSTSDEIVRKIQQSYDELIEKKIITLVN